MGAQQEFLVVVEQVQASLKIGEEHGDGFNALLVGEIFEAFFADITSGHALDAVGLGLQVECFQFLVRESEKIP